MDANAGYQARYSWEKDLLPAEYFQKFSLAQVRRPAAENWPGCWTKPIATG